MASKRKKSRPTKIAGNCEPALTFDDILEEMPFLQPRDESSSRIQRFLEQESVDTPEHRSLTITQSPVSQMLGVGGEKQAKNRNGSKILDESGSPGNSTSSVPTIQFHPLLKDAAESTPNHMLAFPYINALMNEKAGKACATIEPSQPPEPAKRKRRLKDDFPRYSCSTCKYETNRSDHFKRHLMTHSEDKPLKCTTCGYSTGRSDHYKRHLQRHGMSEEEVIECCEKNGLKLKNAQQVLSAEDKLAKENGHKSTILKDLKPGRVFKKPERRYVCTQCGYATDKSSHYHRHVRTHTEDRPYSCKSCYKHFKLPLYLNKHRCSKLSKRTCSICKCIFIDREALLKHHGNEHSDVPFEDIESFMKADLKAQETEVSDGESKPKPTDLSCDDAKKKVNGVGKMDRSNFFKNFTQMASEIICNKILSSESPDEPVAIKPETIKDEHSDAVEVEPNDLPLSLVVSSKTKPDLSSTTATSSQEAQSPNMFVSVKSVLPPLVPSEDDVLRIGKFKCTKCGTWFAKYEECSQHACT